MDASKQREEGYRRALLESGITVDERLIAQCNFLPDGGRRATLQLLESSPKLDAIFCANDNTALGAYEALKERGLRIPEDVAVMGYDDLDIARQLYPKLSSVVLPHREMGRWCVKQILKNAPIKQKRMACPIVVRNSF